jgi:hypothetical protein
MNIETLPLRLRMQTGEYLFAGSDDILLIETQGRYIKIYFDCCSEVKYALRECSLEKIFLHLPAGKFVRLCRFYIINMMRLKIADSPRGRVVFGTGLVVDLKHIVPCTAWNNIGF